uniref:Endonuclease/exonuclease/phosphatase domain-containing protein n=1 Tax=Fagus sylvatica TaxID=28930 RepID=A0A2N9ESV5_FAGSY
MGCQHTSKQIGQALGRLIPVVDSEDEVSWGDFVRIRVALNISKPLCRGKKIDLEGGKEARAPFRQKTVSVDGSLFSHYRSESKSTIPQAPPQSDLADGGSSVAHGVNLEDVLNMATPPVPMSILAWNCRRLGNPCIVQELFRLVWEQDLLVLFVVETRLDTARLEVLQCRLKFSSKLVVSRREHGGGLALFWKQEANLMIKSYSTHHIDTVVNEGIEDSWHFTGFYGVSETHRRHVSWSLATASAPAN